MSVPHADVTDNPKTTISDAASSVTSVATSPRSLRPESRARLCELIRPSVYRIFGAYVEGRSSPRSLRC